MDTTDIFINLKGQHELAQTTSPNEKNIPKYNPILSCYKVFSSSQFSRRLLKFVLNQDESVELIIDHNTIFNKKP